MPLGKLTSRNNWGSHLFEVGTTRLEITPATKLYYLDNKTNMLTELTFKLKKVTDTVTDRGITDTVVSNVPFITVEDSRFAGIQLEVSILDAMKHTTIFAEV